MVTAPIESKPRSASISESTHESLTASQKVVTSRHPDECEIFERGFRPSLSY